MNTVQSSYTNIQKGRGFYSVFATGFTAALAVLFILTYHPIFSSIGIFLAMLAFSGIYAFLKGETWSMSIEDGVLIWSYPRWPKSSGRIDLITVSAVVVDDCSSTLELSVSDGSSRKIKLIGHAAKLRDYLLTHYPHINVKFVEGT